MKKNAEHQVFRIVLSAHLSKMSKAMVFDSRAKLQLEIEVHRLQGKKIGFVPTMGALHEGHLALVRRAKTECDLVVVSIFVNPTQFNNAADLEKYPRMVDSDVELLATLGELIVFTPNEAEVYPENDAFPGVNLHHLDKVLEGEFRPGHFVGVTHVVYNLFSIVKPDFAYFGKKDYQQLAVIKEMVQQLNLSVKIVGCETLREIDGLARSSRNMRLSTQEKELALIIVNTLRFVKELAKKESPIDVQEKAKIYFGKGPVVIEYLEIIDGQSFEILKTDWKENAVCCIAAQCGSVRLIDNVEIFGSEI